MNSNKEMRTRMESIGTYLPSTIVTTRELVASISSRTAPPVEELTGVKERRVYNRTGAGLRQRNGRTRSVSRMKRLSAEGNIRGLALERQALRNE
jgi:hypothetical protein